MILRSTRLLLLFTSDCFDFWTGCYNFHKGITDFALKYTERETMHAITKIMREWYGCCEHCSKNRRTDSVKIQVVVVYRVRGRGGGWGKKMKKKDMNKNADIVFHFPVL